MKMQIKRLDDDFLMEAINDTNNNILMDGSESIGGHHKGMRPMQLLLAAVGGCSSIDIISILKKQRQSIESFELEVDADSVKVEEHSVYKDIAIHFKLRGDIAADKALKAAELSFNKYCSVSMALQPQTRIHYTIEINGELVS
jgi:putative redox protein